MPIENKPRKRLWRDFLENIGPVIVILGIFKAITVVYTPAPIDHSEIETALTSNQPVLLEFHASWCSTCLLQRTALSAEFRDPTFSNIRRFTLNYDLEKGLESKFRVSSQSTLILVRNGKEIARTVGTVLPSSLGDFLRKAI